MMPKYRVGLRQTVLEDAVVEVEADSTEEAERLAVEYSLGIGLQWCRIIRARTATALPFGSGD